MLAFYTATHPCFQTTVISKKNGIELYMYMCQCTANYGSLIMACYMYERLNQDLIFEECEWDRAPSRSSKLSQERISLHVLAISLVDHWYF